MGYKEIPILGIRKIIAERMMQSISNTAQYTENMEVDVSELVDLRERLKGDFERRFGLKLTYTHFFVVIVAKALKEFPVMNAITEDGKIKVYDEINIGVAFALKEGLIVPVIKNVETKGIVEVAFSLDEFGKKITQNTLTMDDVTGGTFTITNLGMFGIDNFTPIINYPQVAILGINRIVKKPVVIMDKIELRNMMTLSLTSDHRIIDGAVAAQFLSKLGTILQDRNLMEEVSKF
jgi:pyruvate dehydrogenase E2 component (dihydrolipoamide acetyltransferase)